MENISSICETHHSAKSSAKRISPFCENISSSSSSSPAERKSLYKSVLSGIDQCRPQRGLYCSIPERGADGKPLTPAKHLSAATQLRINVVPGAKWFAHEAAQKGGGMSVAAHAAHRRQAIRRWSERGRRLSHRSDEPIFGDLVREMDDELDLLNRGPGRPPLNVFKMIRVGARVSGHVADEQFFERVADSSRHVPISLEALLRRQPTYHNAVVNQLNKLKTQQVNALYHSACDEVSAGFGEFIGVGPGDGSPPVFPGGFPAVFYHAFLVEQPKWDKAGWVQRERCIHDASANGVNDATDVGTSITVNTLDSLTATATEYIRVSNRVYSGGYGLLIFDHDKAYRRVKVQRIFLRIVIVRSPASGVTIRVNGRFVWVPPGHMIYLRMDRLFFGEAAAVLAYNVVARLFAIVLSWLHGARLITTPQNDHRFIHRPYNTEHHMSTNVPYILHRRVSLSSTFMQVR